MKEEKRTKKLHPLVNLGRRAYPGRPRDPERLLPQPGGLEQEQPPRRLPRQQGQYKCVSLKRRIS